MNRFMTLLKTELKLSLRGMDMVIFALCLPAVMMVVLGCIYGSRPAFEGAEYTFLAQSFGAVSTIAICAGGVMGLPLLISDYRQKKILKRFWVTPASPALLLAVQAAVYAVYAFASLLLNTAVFMIFFGGRLSGSWQLFLGAFVYVMVTMFSIGIMVGGVAPNAKIAGITASALYFPMLVLSGATLPYEVMPSALQNVSDVMPLTQGIKLLKAAALGLPVETAWAPVAVMLILTAVCTGVSIKYFKWE